MDILDVLILFLIGLIVAGAVLLLIVLKAPGAGRPDKAGERSGVAILEESTCSPLREEGAETEERMGRRALGGNQPPFGECR